MEFLKAWNENFLTSWESNCLRLPLSLNSAKTSFIFLEESGETESTCETLVNSWWEISQVNSPCLTLVMMEQSLIPRTIQINVTLPFCPLISSLSLPPPHPQYALSPAVWTSLLKHKSNQAMFLLKNLSVALSFSRIKHNPLILIYKYVVT